MELRQLQCLVICAQTRSFSKAASVLYTSQSNVSKIIGSLERELGKKLFERKQYGIELTAKGKQIYKHALSIIECTGKIQDCADEEDVEELRISFQPSSWFASAFCEYYKDCGGDQYKYSVIGASFDEIILRITNGLDHLGFGYVEDRKLEQLKEVFRTNHIGYYVLKKAKPVLYSAIHASGTESDETGADEETRNELTLIQGIDGLYNSINDINDRKENEQDEEHRRRMRIIVTTNSDYVMREMLLRTELSNISPEYLGSTQYAENWNVKSVDGSDYTFSFLCMFRNDQVLEALPKRFLGYLREYLE